MSEEIKNTAAELTDEEIEKASGGGVVIDFSSFVECKVLSNKYGRDFCSNKCTYQNSYSCMSCRHVSSISVYVQNEYDEWVKSKNLH